MPVSSESRGRVPLKRLENLRETLLETGDDRSLQYPQQLYMGFHLSACCQLHTGYAVCIRLHQDIGFKSAACVFFPWVETERKLYETLDGARRWDSRSRWSPKSPWSARIVHPLGSLALDLPPILPGTQETPWLPGWVMNSSRFPLFSLKLLYLREQLEACKTLLLYQF